MLRAIWAQAHGRILGADGTMPWHVPEDLAYFSRMTAGSAVIMGRRTWQSFPDRFRPLPGRRNIVVTRDAAFEAPGGETVSSPDEAIRIAGVDAWVIGGGEIYRQLMAELDEVAVTEIDLAVDGDTTAPELGAEWILSSRDPETGWHTSSTGTRYRFLMYARRSARASLEA
ncbi:dihydrofolate reductase [Microbacterium faecale]|uniref:Dihydrofolate reductase n=1 Tax=Microbacterium faecale TaxID=1804630 RepID=A0A916YGN5_9MICO|nr:dihydrofolate reductase [Microbacterium faecale]GGD43873.1 dihydrofolate reductase [Microbacterium faecale]